MTLVLIALAATAATGLALRSLRTAVDAQQAAQELQRRWGVLSCRAVLLPRAGVVLEAAQPRSPIDPPVTQLTTSIVLGAQTLELTFTDEQAKLNVNHLLAWQGRDRAEQALRPFLPQAALDNLRLAQSDTEPGQTAVRSFGQVFEQAPPVMLLGQTADPAEAAGNAPASALTCWGNGRVNVHRASDQALAAAGADCLEIGQIARLLELRRQAPLTSAQRLLDQLALSDEQRQEMSLRLTDTSRCHGLWIVARSDRRSWYSFCVADTSGASADIVRSFDW